MPKGKILGEFPGKRTEFVGIDDTITTLNKITVICPEDNPKIILFYDKVTDKIISELPLIDFFITLQNAHDKS
jgi:hypothetical protein